MDAGLIERSRVDVQVETKLVSCTRCLHWWGAGHWAGTQDLRYVGVSKDARAHALSFEEQPEEEVPRKRRRRYRFVPGHVNVFAHCKGSSELLRERIEELVELLQAVEREVGEMSLKLQEVDVAQPRDCRLDNGRGPHTDVFEHYQTFLLSLSKALPLATLHVQPFTSGADMSGQQEWAALKIKPEVAARVEMGAKLVAASLLCQMFARLIFMLCASEPGGYFAGPSPNEERLQCERVWYLLARDEEGISIVDGGLGPNEMWSYRNVTLNDTATNDRCNEPGGPLDFFQWSVTAPVLGIVTLLVTPLLFAGNANPLALQRLLEEPRVLLLLLQSVLRTGIAANNITAFPVAVRLYSLPGTGGALMAAQLMDLLYFPCSIIAFILMDSLVHTAPRMRCLFGISVLFYMCSELLNSEINAHFPTVLESAEDFSVSISRKIDFSILLMLMSSIVNTVYRPRNLNFITLPTELMELIIFDTSTRNLRAETRNHARKYHESVREVVSDSRPTLTRVTKGRTGSTSKSGSSRNLCNLTV